MREGLLSLAKLALALVLLPLVAAVTVGFGSELENDRSVYKAFETGVEVYVIFYLFLFPLSTLHAWGKRGVSDLFRRVSYCALISRCLPVWTVLILFIFYISDTLLTTGRFAHYFLFAAGWTLAMHVILTAKDLMAEDGEWVRPKYLMTMSFCYVINIAVAALLLHINLESFSFPDFIQSTTSALIHIYELITRKIMST